MVLSNKLTFFALGLVMANGLTTDSQLHAQLHTQFTASAQSQALGRTFASSTSNALDATSNPASLAEFNTLATAVAFANTSFDSEKMSAGVVLPVDANNAFGLSYHRLQADLHAFDGEGQFAQNIGYRLQSLVASYGRRLTADLSLGLNGRVLFLSHIRDDEPEYLGFGFSAQYSLPFHTGLLESVRIGLLAENLVQPEFTPADNRAILPREFRLLIEKPVQIGSSRLDLINNLVLMDKREMDQMGANQRFFAYWGLQYSYDSLFSLRGGFIQNGLVWGAGLRWHNVTLDYAYGDYDNSNFPKNFGFQHNVSVSFALTPTTL